MAYWFNRKGGRKAVVVVLVQYYGQDWGVGSGRTEREEVYRQLIWFSGRSMVFDLAGGFFYD